MTEEVQTGRYPIATIADIANIADIADIADFENPIKKISQMLQIACKTFTEWSSIIIFGSHQVIAFYENLDLCL